MTATLAELERNDQIVFRYATPDGRDGRRRPIRTARSTNIAGICNRERNVAGTDAASGARRRKRFWVRPTGW